MGLIPRAARASLKLALVFKYAEGEVRGHTVNLSESGVLGSFQEVMEVWLNGQLSILVPDRRPIVVETRIVRVDGCTAAMSLMNLTAYDKTKLQSLVDAADEKDDGFIPRPHLVAR